MADKEELEDISEENVDGFDIAYNESYKTFARESLGENDQVASKAVENLRSWIKSQSHLKCYEADAFILLFLRRACFEENLAKEMLENHVKTRVTEPYSEMYPKSPVLSKGMQFILDSGMIFCLPKLAKDGSRIMISRLSFEVKGSFTMIDAFKLAKLSLDLLLTDPAAQLHGITFVDDFSNFSLHNYLSLGIRSPRIISHGAMTHPMHIMNLDHAVHHPNIISFVSGCMKRILSNDILHRTRDHRKDPRTLQDYVDPSVLPEELGGTGGTYQELASKWREYVTRRLLNLKWLNTFEYSKPPE